MSDIKIVVGADVGQAVTGLRAVQGELGKTAGASKSAFAGIGSAISSLGSTLISGGILTGITAIGVGLFELGKSILDTTEAQKRLSGVLDEAKGAYVKATQEVDKLKVAFEQAKTGVITKEEALKLYNNTIGKTIGQTKDLDEAEAKLTAQGENYIKFTLLKAAANIALGKAAEAAFKQEQIRLAGSQGITSAQILGTILYGKEVGKTVGEVSQLNDAIDEQNEFKKIANSLQEQAKAFGFDYNAITEKEVKTQKEKLKVVRTIDDVFKDMNEQIKFLSTRQILLNTNEAKNKIKALETAFDELSRKFGLDSKSPILVSLAFRINEANARLAYADLLARLKPIVSGEREGAGEPLKIVVNVQPQFKISAAGIDPALEQFRLDAGAAINQTVNNIIADTISQTASAIGEALAGGKDVLPRLFDGIIKNIGGQIKELGQYLVKAGIEMLTAKKAIEVLGLTPQTAIIAGFALQILGSFLTAAASKRANNVGFASGTTGVLESGFYNINERGQENVFLPRGTKVQPANEVQAYGGGEMVVHVVGSISGDTILLSSDRARARWGRNN